MSCYLDFHKKRAVRNVTGFFSFQTCLSSKCFKSKIEENQLFRKPLSRSCYRHIAFFHCFLQCLIVHFTFLKLKSCVDFNKWKSCNFSCKAQIPAGNMQTRALVKKFKKNGLVGFVKKQQVISNFQTVNYLTARLCVLSLEFLWGATCEAMCLSTGLWLWSCDFEIGLTNQIYSNWVYCYLFSVFCGVVSTPS